MLKTYDAKDLAINVGGIPITGLADGTFVTISRANDAYTPYAGADGTYSRAKSNDRSGMIVITLAQTSPSNDVLSAMAAADELTGAGIRTVLVKDLRGTTLASSDAAFVQKLPDAEYGKEINTREWTLMCMPLDMNVGGSV